MAKTQVVDNRGGMVGGSIVNGGSISGYKAGDTTQAQYFQDIQTSLSELTHLLQEAGLKKQAEAVSALDPKAPNFPDRVLASVGSLGDLLHKNVPLDLLAKIASIIGGILSLVGSSSK